MNHQDHQAARRASPWISALNAFRSSIRSRSCDRKAYVRSWIRRLLSSKLPRVRKKLAFLVDVEYPTRVISNSNSLSITKARLRAM